MRGFTALREKAATERNKQTRDNNKNSFEQWLSLKMKTKLLIYIYIYIYRQKPEDHRV